MKNRTTIRLSKSTVDEIKRVLNDSVRQQLINVAYEIQERTTGSFDVTLIYNKPIDLFFLGLLCQR
jgi:outer membrane protein assembly factor BamA